MKLTIARKLYAGFGLLLVLTAAIAALGYTRLQADAEDTRSLYQNGALGMRHAGDTNAQMIASAREEKRAILTAPGEARNKLIEAARTAVALAGEAAK